MSLTRSSIVRVFESISQYIEGDESVNKLMKVQKLMRTRRQRCQRKSRVLAKSDTSLPKVHKNTKLEDVRKDQNSHRIPLDEIYAKYKTSPITGLTQQEAARRLEEFGKNQIEEPKKPHWALQFLKQMSDPFSLFLWFLIVLAFIGFGFMPNDFNNLWLALILLITIFSGAMISYTFNKQTADTIESIREFIPNFTSVFRDGQIKDIRAEKLVIGDIVVAKQGEKIPADIRIIQCAGMKMNNATFTGQSNLVRLCVECTNPGNFLQSKNMAFSGSFLEQGEGRGVVIRVGNQTLIAKIAEQILNVDEKSSSVQKEVTRYVLIMTVWALSVGTFVFSFGMIIGFIPLIAAMIAIGVTVASAPGVLNLVVVIMMTSAVKKLAEYNMICKNLYVVESLGSTSCLCTDKTGTLTQNKMTVKSIWYNQKIYAADNIEVYGNSHNYEYNIRDPTFRQLHKCAVLSSIARFNEAPPRESLLQLGSNKRLTWKEKQKREAEMYETYGEKIKSMKYIDRPVLGDPSETALVRFFQPISDINATRNKYPVAKNMNTGIELFLPFTTERKYSMALVKELTDDSDICVYTKGAPQRVLNLCTKVMVGGQQQSKTEQFIKGFHKTNKIFADNGQRVLAFAKMSLPRQHNKFELKLEPPNIPIYEQTFLGMISLNDPPKKGVQTTMLRLKAAGIKIIMLTGDQVQTATAIARQVNIITCQKTANQIAQERGIDLEEAMMHSNAIVLHGDDIVKMRVQDQGLAGSQKGQNLAKVLQMKEIVFARTNPYQKYIIVEALQKMGHVVAVTGDGVNDSPAVKLADAGLCMGSGSDATRDSADIIMIEDNINQIIEGIYEGRKMFDNLKKCICYVMTSQTTQFLPFFCLIMFRIPIPIFTLLIDAAADFVPSISFAYQEGERGIMTRRPRNQQEHLVTAKLILHCSGWMGFTQFLACFACYFICMNDFGFELDYLWGKSNIPILLPTMWDSYNPSDPHFGNSNLARFHTCAEFNAATESLDWINSTRPWADLRMTALLCKTREDGTIFYEHNMTFKQCSVQQISIATNRPICYTTEATKYGQTSYMYGNVVAQIFNLFACKTRRDSVFMQGMNNKVMYFGIAIQLLLSLILAETYFMITLIGTRDCIFLHFGLPAIPIGMLQLMLEQGRKYLIRHLPRDNQGDPTRDYQDCKPNWFERNIMW